MKVSIETVLMLKWQLRQINQESLEDIEWTFNGETLDVAWSDIDNWKFTGLNNTDFVNHIIEKYKYDRT